MTVDAGGQAPNPVLGYAELVLRAARYWLPCAIIGGLIGAVSAWTHPAPFVSRAEVRVGNLYGRHMVEAPLIAAKRIQGFGTLESEGSPSARVEAHPRFKPRYRGRIIDVLAFAETESASLRLRDAALARFLETHASYRAFEERIEKEFDAFCAARVPLIERMIAEKQADGAMRMWMKSLRTARRSESSVDSRAESARTHDTEVLSRSPSAKQAPRRLFFTASGAIAGVVLGFALFLLVSFVRLGDPADPLLFLFRLSRRHVLVAAGLGVLVGVAYGATRPQMFSAHGVFLTAHVGYDGADEGLDDTIARLRAAVAEGHRDICPRGCRLSVQLSPLRIKPSNITRTQLVDVHATASTEEGAEAAVEYAFETLEDLQNPLFQEEYDYNRQHLLRLERDLEMLEAIDDQRDVYQTGVYSILREKIRAEREINPARSHPVQFLGRVVSRRLPSRWIEFGLLGTGVGALLGFLAACFLQAARRLRQ